MNRKQALIVFAVFAAVTALSFFGGRRVEIWRAEASRTQVKLEPVATPQPPSKTPDYHFLNVRDIVRQPFPLFYEALRSAPREVRAEWANQLEQLPKGPQKVAAIRGFYKLLVQLDPDAAIHSKTVYTNSAALAGVVNAAPQSALPQLAEMIFKVPRDIQNVGSHDDYDATILYEWSQIDPAAVAAFIDAHDVKRASSKESDGLDHYIYASLRRGLLTEWMAIDPPAARAWATREGIDLSKEAITDYLQGWFVSDRTAAIKYALQHSDEERVQESLSFMAAALFDESGDEASAFVQKLPTPELRAGALQEIAHRSWFASMNDPSDAIHASRRVADWLLTFPNDMWKSAFAEALLPYWPEGEEDLCEWIQQLPPEVRDDVASQYKIPAMEQNDFDKSVSAILTINDTDLRDEMLVAMFRHLPDSPENAAAAVKNLSLTNEQREHLLKLIDRVANESAEPDADASPGN